jgi:hypothetical protein
MSIKYSSIVPWGRSFNEYVAMFNLKNIDLQKNILGCGDGPASFNSELTKKGGNIVSIDPIYKMTKKDIQNRINDTYDEIVRQTEENKKRFVWKKFKNVQELANTRLKSMNIFLDDFEKGLKEKRYLYAEMPQLPFFDNQFDLSLSSHFLFLYSDNLDFDFHLSSIKEILRVSKETRIFPIVDLNNNQSIHLNGIIDELQNEKYLVELKAINYEFQKGANKMLRIKKY